MATPAKAKEDYLPIGRPSNYNQDIITLSLDYINGGYITAGDPVPIIAGLAVDLGVGKSTLFTWANEHPEFQDVLEKLRARQERVLAEGGLTKRFDTSLTKLFLSTHHGYSDKTLTESHATLELIDPTGSDAARRVLFAMMLAQQAITDQSNQLPAISTDSKVNQTTDKA